MWTKKRIILTTIGVALGGIGGFAYYYYIGCASGSCSITSSPYNSTMYGMLMGGLAGDMFKSSKK